LSGHTKLLLRKKNLSLRETDVGPQLFSMAFF
jgi:hypothetical protein